jgi:hypothetical protein
MNTSAANYHHYNKLITKAIEDLGNVVETSKDVAPLSDFTRLMTLYLDALRERERMCLNSMYLGEGIAQASERLANSEDQKALSELTTLLKSL